MEIAFDDEYNQGSSRFKFKLSNSINWTKPKDVYQFKTKEACLNHAKFKGNSFIFAYDSEYTEPWRGSDDRAWRQLRSVRRRHAGRHLQRVLHYQLPRADRQSRQRHGWH